MKKIFILIMLILLVTGCSDEVDGKYSMFWTYCDQEYDVEYIINGNSHHGGITIRLDENGNVIHCSERKNK